MCSRNFLGVGGGKGDLENSRFDWVFLNFGLPNGQGTSEESFTQFGQQRATLAARFAILEEHVKAMEARGEENLQ